jgi:hypothetical protein
MALTDIVARRPHPLSRLLAWITLLGLAIAVAAALAQARAPVSCKYHRGSFSDDFTPDLDINRVNCRSPWSERSPTLHLWAVPPCVGIEWAK